MLIASPPGSRFTPTGVGTAGLVCSRLITVPVHPHGRGDGAALFGPHGYEAGSPPRAWGRPSQDRAKGQSRRFTPTGVGTADAEVVDRHAIPVHPHGRGDGSPKPRVTWGLTGSPPRAWGRQDRERCFIACYRFTPTGVGTAAAAFNVISASAVHPHGRGDGAPPPTDPAREAGSPPRAWGRRFAGATKKQLLRFTPTGVGTALPLRASGVSRRFTPTGVGTALAYQSPGDAARFTPTGVGTAVVRCHSVPPVTVHPHGRGDGTP